MRSILITTGIILSQFCAAQKIQPGVYSTRQAIGGIQLVLTDSARFYWVADDCNAGILGTGHWKAKKNRLTLAFDSIRLAPVPPKEARLMRQDNHTDSLVITVHAFWERDPNKPVSFATLYDLSTRRGAMLDSNGKGTLRCKGPSAQLQISGPGLITDTLPITEPGNWWITCYAREIVPRFIGPHTVSYKLFPGNKQEPGFAIQPASNENNLPGITYFYYRRDIKAIDLAFSLYWLSKQY